MFSSEVDLRPVIQELVHHNVTNRTWIASEVWVTSALNQPGVRGQLGVRVQPGVHRYHRISQQSDRFIFKAVFPDLLGVVSVMMWGFLCPGEFSAGSASSVTC